MSIILWIAIFAVSLFALLKAADFFMSSAEVIGIHFKVPSFIIGATVIALGTSLPELASSIFAVLNDTSEIVAGNVIGSNIANVLLILGVAAVVAKNFEFNSKALSWDFFLLLMSTLLVSWFIWDKDFTTTEAIICIGCFVAYIVYVIKFNKIVDEHEEQVSTMTKWTPAIFLLSGIGVFVGAKYTILSIENIAESLNIGKDIIALTVVALGTSLPELAVSISGVRKGQHAMVLGNVIGSNIFNIFGVMGVPRLIGAYTITTDILILSLPVMMLSALLLFLNGKFNKLRTVHGITFLLLYAGFIYGTVTGFNLLEVLGLQAH